MTVDRVVAFDGPPVRGQETVVTLYDPEQLRDYSNWKQLLPVVNRSFKVSHQDYWPLDVFDRFGDSQSFLDELEPEFFTFIISSKSVDQDGHIQVYATASARTLVQHAGPSQEALAGFRGEVRHVPGQIEAWELKILAVDTLLYRTGLGSMLQSLVEEEIKKRAREARLQRAALNEGNDSTGIIYTLTTVAEVNEDYYLKKGYKTTKLTPLLINSFHNVKECHIAHMEKTIRI